MKRFNFNLLGSYFLRGTFIVAPLFFTVFALWRIFSILDSPIQELFYKIFDFRLYGVGLLTVLIVIIFVGYLGTTILMDRVFRELEKLIFKIPLVKEIYKAIKDIIGAFASDKKKFEKPVMVKVGEGIYRIGFVTQDNLDEFEISDTLVSVYFPLSYAFTGELLIIEKSLITPLDSKDVKDLMKFVISGGLMNAEGK